MSASLLSLLSGDVVEENTAAGFSSVHGMIMMVMVMVMVIMVVMVMVIGDSAGQVEMLIVMIQRRSMRVW